MAKHHETNLMAAGAAILCIAVGYLSRDALNPDGVSYLDLVAAMQRGDWLHFVQGYWSPLFPLLVGGAGQLFHRSGAELVAITHELNTVAALAAIVVLWRWALRSTPGPLGRALFAAFLLASAGLPRIEAVTPDVLLLFVMTWLSYELIVNAGRRWLLIGLLLGTAFLAKTSSWPWLLAAIPVRSFAATPGIARRRVLWSTLACAAVMLSWIVPLSIKYGHPTAGSSGALNWTWYLDASTSRLPDTDQGTHRDYHDINVGNGRLLTVATFEDAAYWTYQPWGDPTAWSAGELGAPSRAPTASELVSYWLRMLGRVFVLWSGPLIAGALLPWLFLRRRAGMLRELVATQRDALAAISLGLAGLLQFAAVHAEPRLLAPFAMMLALGTLHWCFAGGDSAAIVRHNALRSGLAWLGTVVMLGFAVPRLIDGVQSADRLSAVTAQLGDLRRRLGGTSDSPVPIAVVGPAAPVMASAFWVNARIAMQVAPRFAALVATLPKQEQDDMLLGIFRGKVPLIWKTTAEGGIEILVVRSAQ